MRILGLLFIISFLSACSPDMKKYTAIVDKLKAFELPQNQSKRFRITDFDNLTILEESDSLTVARGQGTGLVWVYQTADNLVVYIETEDRGHGGEFGYAYAENGERPGWPGEGALGYWSIDEQVDENWWRVSYLLD